VRPYGGAEREPVAGSYDKALPVDDGRSYLGVAVEHLIGTGEYSRGDSDVRATDVAFCNTWYGSKGHYYDVICGKAISM
jgi:hypothetical protein